MYTRKCPSCQKELSYTTKGSRNLMEKMGKLCKSCVVKNEYIKNPNKNRGESNGMYNNNLMSAMIKKYGQTDADEKYKKWKENLHRFGCGELNPQYGKSPFADGGRSYHGWYMGIYFRSSFELIFIMENIDNEIITADNSKFRVEYYMEGKKKFYYPDFYSKKLNVVYEVKSNEWLSDDINVTKRLYARNHFESIGIEYKTFTENDMLIFSGVELSKKNTDFVTFRIIRDKFLDGDIKLTIPSIERLERRLEKRGENKNLEKLRLIKNGPKK